MQRSHGRRNGLQCGAPSREELEEAADWLAGSLLVSDQAAFALARGRLAVDLAAERYGVSEAMMRFRLNVTGAAKRVGQGSGPRS